MASIDHLLLSKYIFLRAEELADTNNPMACGLAISLFHDSVELLIWTVAKEVDANVNEKDAFIKIFEAIKEGKDNKEKKQLPLKAKLIELNKARINFKHYGNMPAPTEAIKFLGYTEEFLRETIRLFFNLDFDAISMVDLITNVEIRNRLKEAELLLVKGDLGKALCKCGEAEYFIGKIFKSLFPEVGRNIEDAAYLFEREKIHDTRALLRYIREYLNSLRSLCIINVLGIRLPDYIKYKNIAPNVDASISGKFFFNMKPRKETKIEVDYCIKYVTKSALFVQDKLKSN